MAVDSDNIYGGGATVFKVGGVSGTDVGATRGGVEITRSLTVHKSEIDQNTAALKARTIMNEMHIRTSFAEGLVEQLAFAWNIDGSTAINASSLYVTDSDDLEKELYFEGPGPTGDTTKFHAYRGFAMGDMSFSFARDADVEAPVDFELLLDTTKTPSRFADMWHS